MSILFFNSEYGFHQIMYDVNYLYILKSSVETTVVSYGLRNGFMQQTIPLLD